MEDEQESIRKEHLQRLREYEKAREPYERSLWVWEQEVAKVKQRRKAHEKRMAIVDRARRRVEDAFRPKSRTPTQRPSTLDFEILPPGERTDEHIREYYREVVSRGQLKGCSQDPLEKMIALPRKGWWKGRARSYGYIVLEFGHTDKVLLECPVEDNAMYVLDSGERRLLEMSKQQMIESSEAKRLFHSGNDWYRRLKDELGIE